MLSNQTRTNHTGKHQRQRSTPMFQESYQSILPGSHFGQSSGQQHSICDNQVLEESNAPRIQTNRRSVEGIKRQQDGQLFLQATQQTISRPGYSQGPDTGHSNDHPLEPSLLHNHVADAGYISTDAINALLMELKPGTSSIDSETSKQSINVRYSPEHAKTSVPVGLSADHWSQYEVANVDSPANANISLKMHDDRTARRKQHMSLDLTNSQLITDVDCLHRPQTPVRQQSQGPLPKTPMTAPVGHRFGGRFDPERRFPDCSAIEDDPDMTIKASQSMERGRSCQDSFSMMRGTLEGSQSFAPSKTTHKMRRSVDIAFMPSPKLPNMSDLKLDLSADAEGSISSFYQPPAPSTMTSYQSSPETPTMSLFGSQHVDNSVANATDSWVQTIQKHGISQSGQTSPTQMTQHQRAQSMTDTDFDECVVSTGVTADDIAAFIQGPFPDDSKWRCLYKEKDGEECGKRFARKENAKSHVQTHLGDRQYACKVCRTRFVRQHDLKRHFKIHTTEKPHRCPCGKDFHRHDALTRHRQRGMCVGAFKNSPKKSVKRGRPKKPRPSSEERAEKAAQTRQRIMEKTCPGSTYASSISGSSDDSHGSPPSFDNFSNAASSPSLSHKGLDNITFSCPSYQPLTPPTSPIRGSDKSYSSPYSQKSYTPKPASRSPSPKITSIPEEAQQFMDTLDSGNDYYQSSPPELELSSSSPATSNLNFTCISSDAPNASLSHDQIMDCLSPQIVDTDFQLYGESSKDSPASELDTFFDFGEYQSPATEQKRQQNDSLLGQNFYGNSLVNEPEDPFAEF